METALRKPLQGMTNIIRFNWHFYAVAAAIIMMLFLIKRQLSSPPALVISVLLLTIIISTLVSLLASCYIYDLSGLYKLRWLEHLKLNHSPTLVNINAGFDETSSLIRNKYPLAELRVVDFYDPSKHTEVSIKRARKAYPAFKNTENIRTSDTFLQQNSADVIFLILSAHEIRNFSEKAQFFKHLAESIKDDGRIVVVEHLRNLSNFLVYNVGFFHFFSEKNWKRIFESARLRISKQENITPFIVAFSLEKNGTAS